ncbi:hypothetical protein [Laceyella sacchari]|uniref:hypothetical protein n=1 Tax=Laceyella sacchari TaxID=37482 RepID=UPI001049E904|nr:hypothetical protein [Laceyella sacchari]
MEWKRRRLPGNGLKRLEWKGLVCFRDKVFGHPLLLNRLKFHEETGRPENGELERFRDGE